MLWTPILCGRITSRAAGRNSFPATSRRSASESVSQIRSRALRHRDQPDGFVERLRADAPAADLRLGVDRVQRIVEVPGAVREQDLAGPLRITGVVRDLVQDAAV